MLFSGLTSVKCAFWKQKSGIKWLKEGDANTAFFHAIVKQRRNKNFIARIKEKSGTWLESAELIKDSTIDFYSKHFSSNGYRGPFSMPFEVPPIGEVDNNMIKELPALKKVREIIFEMNAESAPGPDGFGVGFYQSCWEVIKENLLSAIQDFFKGTEQPKG
nr:uncharacterized protein LOC113699764 [Coffea arabica]